MIRRVLLSTMVLVATACCGTNTLAQGQSPALQDALGRIGTGMTNAGLKFMRKDPDTRQVDIWTFQALRLDSCDIQIQWTIDTTASPGKLSQGVLTNVFTVPLAKLDSQKIHISHESGSAMTLTSSRDWEKGYFSLRLPTIGEQKTINYVALGARKGVKQTFDGKVNLVHIDFKYQEPAQNVAAAFVEASRLCREKGKSSP